MGDNSLRSPVLQIGGAARNRLLRVGAALSDFRAMFRHSGVCPVEFEDSCHRFFTIQIFDGSWNFTFCP
jgi:hypothetical protein